MNENKNNNNKKNSYSAAMQKQQKNSKGNTFKYTGPINTSQGSVGSAYSTTSTPSKRSDDNYESQQQVEEIQFPQLSPDVFKSQPLLLRDEQIISFITNGYLVIKPEELPKEWHNQVMKCIITVAVVDFYSLFIPLLLPIVIIIIISYTRNPNR